MAPFVCVSGVRTIGSGVPVVKLTISIAVGSYERCNSAAETVSVSVFIVIPRVNVSPIVAVLFAGDSASVTPVKLARLCVSCVFC